MVNQVANINPADYQYLQFFAFELLDNWSSNAALANKIGFSNTYPFAKLKSFLKRNRTSVTIVNETKYRRVKVKLYGNGVEVRDEVFGHEIKTKSQWQVKKGQFIISKIDARNGAFGVAGNDVHGAIVTNDFPVYDVDLAQIKPEFLYLVTTTKAFQELCHSLSSGTTGRQRVDEAAFLNISIPLPSKSEQEKIVDDYNKKIAAADKARKESEQLVNSIESYILKELGVAVTKQEFKKGLQFVEFKDLSVWSAEKLFSDSSFKSSKYPTYKLADNKELYVDIFRGKSPKYDSKSKSIILNQKCNRWNEINLEFAKTVNPVWLKSIDTKFLTHEHDILINSTGEGTIGRSSLITSPYVGYLYDSHILCLRLATNIIHPEFFVHQFNSSFIQMQINEIKSAQSTKQTELGIDNTKNIYFVVPDIEVQQSIAVNIRAMHNKIAKLQSDALDLTLAAKTDFEQLLFKK